MRLDRRAFVALAAQFAVAAVATACGETPAQPTVGRTVVPAGTTPPAAGAATSATTAPTVVAAVATTTAPATVAPTAAATAVLPTVAPTVAASVAPTMAPAITPARAASNVTLTMYNAQHENLVKAMVEGFTKETGIKVALRNGKDFDLANQIVQEGAASPADVFITENSPATQLVASKGLFAPVDKAVLAQIPARFSPTTGEWVGVASRVTVLVYNPQKLPANMLPLSIMDIATPAWKDRVGIAPSGADFQAIASAVLAIKGNEAAGGWLRGLKANAKVYSGNGAILRAVNAGEIPAGIIYHYYWYGDRAESGMNSRNTELYFFPNKDPGGFVSVSGLGTLKSSKNAPEAQSLLRYMTGAGGQQILADSTALEYSLNESVKPNPKLKPLSELSIPDVDIATLNGPQVIGLMQQAGLL